MRCAEGWRRVICALLRRPWSCSIGTRASQAASRRSPRAAAYVDTSERLLAMRQLTPFSVEGRCMSIESLRRRFRNQCEGSNRALVCFTAVLAGATTAAIFWTVKQYAWPIATATVDSSWASRPQLFMPAVIAVILLSYIAGAVSASAIVCFGEPNKPQRGRAFPPQSRHSSPCLASASISPRTHWT